jgi:hypothetical protein
MSASTSERRESPRINANLCRPLHAEVGMDDVLVPGAVTPYDLSENGISGKWEWALPPDRDFELVLNLGKRVKMKARVVWQRPLPDHQHHMAGLAFLPLSKSAVSALRAYLRSLQGEGRRASERVADVLPVELLVPQSEESITLIASDLSREGLQLTCDFPLENLAQVHLLLPLTLEAPLEVKGHVRWVQPTPFGGSLAGVQFDGLSAEQTGRLDTYLRIVSEQG